MNKHIEIRGLRHIAQLRFDLPKPGVYLLAGENGAGKSSLLACLLRIGDRNAFPKYFVTSHVSHIVDRHERAEIAYGIDGDTVTYSYGGSRWVPHPRRHSNLVDRFGYPAVIYVAADARRIEPVPDDFTYRRVRPAHADIINGANEIFSTTRFNDLRTINIRRGTGSSAFLLAETQQRGKYFSERNFSLGELCILKLLRQLHKCKNDTLLLIDELELALHPRAQVKLFQYLETVAATKRLTVLFSTHSPTLIRKVPRKQVLLLRREGDSVECVSGCYPAFALGEVAFPDEIPPDVVLYVEDDMARNIVAALVRNLARSMFSSTAAPTVVVVPVGGFMEVIRFLARSKSMLLSSTKPYALLDADVVTESLADYRAKKKYRILAEFESVKDMLAYLPWTPEVGLCAYLTEDLPVREREVRAFFGDHRITLDPSSLRNVGALAKGDQRKRAKVVLRDLAAHVAEKCACPQERAEENLGTFFANALLGGPGANAIKELFMPCLGGS